MVRRKYDQLNALTSSSDAEISRLSIVVKNLKERLESIEKSQHDLLDKLNSIETDVHSLKPKGDKMTKYACDMCAAKFNDSKHLQSHRKNVHKAPHNI